MISFLPELKSKKYEYNMIIFLRSQTRSKALFDGFCVTPDILISANCTMEIYLVHIFLLSQKRMHRANESYIRFDNGARLCYIKKQSENCLNVNYKIITPENRLRV